MRAVSVLFVFNQQDNNNKSSLLPYLSQDKIQEIHIWREMRSYVRMVTSLLWRILWWIAVCIGFSEEEPDSSPVEQQTLAQPSMEMESSSQNWQVFVSFSGEDTRNNFTSHLVAALKQRCINYYMDNTSLRKGDAISQALKEAIQSSRIALVILSKNYASSSWCLNELSWIIECRKKHNQIVVPIFYHVDPSDVRKQTGSFAEHSRKKSTDEVKKWRSSLEEIGQLSGHHLTIHERSEHELIEKIVKDISTELSFGSSNNFPHLVGIQSRIEQVTSLLFRSESKEVVKVGIWGMGGIGKTTIAEAVFQQISDTFEGHCFLPNVREQSEKNGVNFLRNELVCSVLQDNNIKISTSLLPPVIEDRLRCKKVLIVIDDVIDPGQLDTLLCNHCFGRGSRILVTSRDRQVLQQVVDEIYQVQGLINGEDIQLFNLFAFKERYPKDDFVALSGSLVKCAQGVPVALRVLGSALKGKSSEEWKGFLDKLKDTPNRDIQKILRITYDDLDDEKQKTIFLDIACFFRGNNKAFVSKLYGDSADYDISVLKDKSLIVETNNKLEMHDLLQEMGWDIVFQESVSEPGERSRLWKHEDVCYVLKNNSGTKAVQGIALKFFKELHITPTAIERMNNLRILNFSFHSSHDDSVWNHRKLYVTGNELSSLSGKLNYLRWDGCPLKSLPLKCCAENLVSLILPFSNLEKLWDGEQNLANLKWIILRGSKNLLEIPNLYHARNLECIDLSYCTSLCDIPNCVGLTSLETLNVEGCSRITKFPKIFESIGELNLSGTGIQEVPASISGFSRLEYLGLMNCPKLQIIPRGVCCMESLKYKEIRLSSFSNLERSEELLGSIKCLNMVKLSEYKLSTEQIEFVVDFNHRNSIEMEWFRNCIRCMASLKKLHCFIQPPGELLHNLQNLQSLESVNISYLLLSEFPSCLTNIFLLKDIRLSCNRIGRIPESIKRLSALEKLDLSDCWRLKSIPELPIGLKYLIADDCYSLESVSTPLTTSAYVRRISFLNCDKLDTSTLENEAQNIILHRAQGDVKLCTKGCIDNEPLIISYPGSEIPKWFSDKSRRSDEITIKLPTPQCHDDYKNHGIAFAAIIELNGLSFDQFDFGVKCGFISENGVSHQFEVPLIRSDCNGCTWFDSLKEVSHVVMGYSCRWHCELLKFSESNFMEASFLFSCNHSKYLYSQGRRIKIKKCGVCYCTTKMQKN